MIRRGCRFLLALLAGYTVMILLIFLVQEALFGGVSYQTTPLPQLLAAGALTTIAAFVGGIVAARCFGASFFPPALAMCALVALETTYMIAAGRMPGPVWFDVLASGSLLLGILGGSLLVQRRIGADAPPAHVSV